MYKYIIYRCYPSRIHNKSYTSMNIKCVNILRECTVNKAAVTQEMMA